MLDGCRGEVFAALYSERGERIWEPLVCRPEELARARRGAAGRRRRPPAPGRYDFGTSWPEHGVRIADDADPVHRVAARHICALAAAADGTAGPLAPIYLRPPDAERWRERDSFQRAE